LEVENAKLLVVSDYRRDLAQKPVKETITDRENYEYTLPNRIILSVEEFRSRFRLRFR
jgi:hypothetical protein